MQIYREQVAIRDRQLEELNRARSDAEKGRTTTTITDIKPTSRPLSQADVVRNSRGKEEENGDVEADDDFETQTENANSFTSSIPPLPPRIPLKEQKPNSMVDPAPNVVHQPDLPAPRPTKIFFTSRTHTQITQAVKALKSCASLTSIGPMNNGESSLFVCGRSRAGRRD